MKNKTILGLTMAFVMGALVVTPLFAQYISEIPKDSTNWLKSIVSLNKDKKEFFSVEL